MDPASSQRILSPQKRFRKMLLWSFGVHIVLFLVPMLLGVLADWLEDKPEELSINLVDEPSTGPEVAAETQRLPPSPKPETEVNPPPVPDVPAPPEPELASLPAVPVPPEPELADLPMPVPEKKKPEKKAPPEPKVPLPKFVKKPKPAKLPDPDRTLKNTRKVGQRTGSQTNPDIPVGKRDTAQQYGEKFSNTPQGGPNSDRYNALLKNFLRICWAGSPPEMPGFVPARAQLGNVKPEVTVFLSISGDGRLLEARIERPSGNPAMDSAVRRMLEYLKTRQLPRSPDGRPWSNRVIFDTSG